VGPTAGLPEPPASSEGWIVANPLIKRTKVKRAIIEARGSVGRLIDAAEALEVSKARGEVTSRARWLLTAMGKLEVAIQAEAGLQAEEERRRRAIEAGRPEATARMEEAARIGEDMIQEERFADRLAAEEERICAEAEEERRIVAEGDPLPFPHYNEHDDSAYQCGKDRDDR
jgi:hypothetical protein